MVKVGDPEEDFMGFMDKVKEQASVAAAAAKDAAQKGQAKVGEVQAKRAKGTTESDIAGYVESLKAYEAEFGELDGTDSSS
jgi:hypothetical protein